MKKAFYFILIILCFSSLIQAKTQAAKKTPNTEILCTDANLLAGLTPQSKGQVRPPLNFLSDGKIYEEGAFWDEPQDVLIWPQATLLYDLGHENKITAAFIQADNNDLYLVEGSNNGKDFSSIALFSPVAVQGLQSRWVSGIKGQARYLRVSASGGDNFYSISELGLFCKTPAVFPPKLAIIPSEHRTPSPWEGGMNDYKVTVYKVVLCLIGFAFVAWGYYLKKMGRPKDYRFFRMTLLGIVALFSYASYYNFFHWHFENSIHTWEVYHYYMGSKYFPELGYPGLYECTTLADSEDGLAAQLQGRRIRDHRSNTLRPANYILENPDLCKHNFSAWRWNEFKKDLSWFRGVMDLNRWTNMQQDHGYNPPPVWTMIGRAVGSFFSPTTESIQDLVKLDILLILLVFASIGWAFGLETLLLAILVWGLCYPSRYYWIGGAFLRQSWFASAMIGLCFLKKEKYLIGGILLALSSLITVFPLFFIVGLGIKIAHQWITTKKLSTPHKRFAVGVVAGGMTLFLLSLPGSGGGIGAYQGFLKTISTHMSTPLTNHMGLKTLVAFRPSTKAERTIANGRDDPFEVWKMERRKAFQSTKPLFWLIIATVFFFFWKGARNAEDWEVAAFGFILIPMMTELTCYYYSFVVAGALMASKRPRLSLALMATTLAWLAAEFYWDWFDVKYTYESLVAILLCFYVLWEMQATGSCAPTAQVPSSRKGSPS
ncbi:MAG: hypothetical protein HY073_02720 [Deltaproteobacteria bacterium]|nr:hypothetical protein [Deltaproteobacteria bacterium]